MEEKLLQLIAQKNEANSKSNYSNGKALELSKVELNLVGTFKSKHIDKIISVYELTDLLKSEGIPYKVSGGILCSIIAYLLGITVIDPTKFGIIQKLQLSNDKYNCDVDIEVSNNHYERVEDLIINKVWKEDLDNVRNSLPHDEFQIPLSKDNYISLHRTDLTDFYTGFDYEYDIQKILDLIKSDPDKLESPLFINTQLAFNFKAACISLKPSSLLDLYKIYVSLNRRWPFNNNIELCINNADLKNYIGDAEDLYSMLITKYHVQDSDALKIVASFIGAHYSINPIISSLKKYNISESDIKILERIHCLPFRSEEIDGFINYLIDLTNKIKHPQLYYSNLFRVMFDYDVFVFVNSLDNDHLKKLSKIYKPYSTSQSVNMSYIALLLIEMKKRGFEINNSYNVMKSGE